MTTYYLGGGVGNSVTGNQSVAGNQAVSGNLTVTDIIARNISASGTLGVSQLSTLSGGVDVSGTSTFNGIATFNGATTIDNTLTVTGNTTLQGLLNTTALATLGGGLIVNGTSSLNGDTTITGNASVSGTANVTGDTILNAKLTVTDTTQLNGGLTVTGGSNLSGDSNLTGNLSVTGNTSVTGSVTAGNFVGDGSGLTNINATHPTTVSTGAAYTIGDDSTVTPHSDPAFGVEPSYVQGIEVDTNGHVTNLLRSTFGLHNRMDFDQATGLLTMSYDASRGSQAPLAVDLDGRYLTNASDLIITTDNGLGIIDATAGTVTANQTVIYDLTAGTPTTFNIGMTGEFAGDLTVSAGQNNDGTAGEPGNITASGNATFGSLNTNIHTFQGNVVPQVTDTFDLGTTALRWNNIHVKNLATGLTQHNVPFVGANGVLVEDAAAVTYTSTGAGTGTFTVGDTTAGMDVDAATGNITTNGTLTVEGNVTLGNADTDTQTITGTTTITGQLNVDNIRLDGNAITTTDTDGTLTVTPNGTGDVHLVADTVQVGDSNVNAVITTNGTGDLTLNTNNGTNSGSIVIADGVNGDVTINPDGTGNSVVNRLVCHVVPTGSGLPATPIAGMIVYVEAADIFLYRRAGAWVQF